MSTATVAPPRRAPDPARAARRAHDRALGVARERLVAALDLLGDRPPVRGELGALVRLAGEAFAPESAAAKMLRLLVIDRAGSRR